MQWLNYHHLHYFWMVAREGSVTAAAEHLRLSPSTVSDQIHKLEDSLGVRLFRKVGRRLVLTDRGELTFRYADEIFHLGGEMMGVLHGEGDIPTIRLEVGVAESVPKLMAWLFLEPSLALDEGIRLICREDRPEKLLSDLSLGQLDLVISDAPVGSGTHVATYNHLLAECDVSVFGTRELADGFKEGFPGSMDGAPFLLPTVDAALRRSVDHWFEREGIRPKVVGEFGDSALMKVCGQSGAGFFVSPELVGEAVIQQYGVVRLGSLEGVRERYFAAVQERRAERPGVSAILSKIVGSK